MRTLFRLSLLAVPMLIAATDDPKPTPIGDPASWIASDDYPPDALRTGAEGTTAFRLDVGKAGKPMQCTIMTSSGSASLDDTTCARMMERARFTPAKDGKGRAVASSFYRRVVWRLPEDDGRPVPIEPHSMSMTFFVETDGSITGCEAILDGKSQGNSGPCMAPFGGRPVQPMHDASGKPVRQKFRMTSSLEKIDSKP